MQTPMNRNKLSQKNRKGTERLQNIITKRVRS